MYDDTTCRIKFQNGLSEEFVSNRGVKQGDVLSPLLFNLYINNLVKSLQDANTDPIVIGDTTINSLLFADDIVLLSNSEKGLQTALNVLSDFCKCWKLEVNINKSKVIIFNSNGKTHNNFFRYNNEFLETVKSYCYLGMTLQHTGNLNLCSSLLVEKGRKALFKIKKTIGLNNQCKLLEKLFDSLVVPIALYGSEVWGIGKQHRDSDPFEHLQYKFIKEILGTHCKASNAAC
ncbi:unnamed protein product [Mytilus edulis]|uniref:Reverse transcriptase domain-containing protein n=1 Tax=Mytilus edulis TaxID=6550 RepID=A0A8S3PYJ5_MYTED|nr:unnamed protein product [Mytilus edulis]